MLIVLFAAGCAKKEADLGPARNAITADGLLGGDQNSFFG